MVHKEIYLVPYAHLDTQWRWEYPTTIKKYIKNTIEENLALFDKYPGHQFNFTGARRYSMMKEYYPEQFPEVKRLVEEQRWHLAGTSLDETDALVPSVESMIRNILYGDRWFKAEFGTSSRDYMIPDCFGFPANMPSVLAHCGIVGFSSQKLTWNSAVGIPFEIGVWEGPDGKGVVSALNPCAYVSRVFPKVHRSLRRLKRLNKMGKKTGIWKSFQYYGVGDIGGAPKEGSVKRAISSIEHSQKKDTELVVRQGAADQFFEELSEDEKDKMDRYKGDLLLINHSAGTLTSAAIMKRWNRMNEQRAFAAEMAAISASLIAGAAYPSEKIQSAWYRTIGSQMHDILPGTSTPVAYEYSQNDEIIALNIWSSMLHDSAVAIAPFIKGDGSILLFNPLGEPRRDMVEIDLPGWIEAELDENGGQGLISVCDVEGTCIPAQIKKREPGRLTALFAPQMEPFSWARYSISKTKHEPQRPFVDGVSLQKNQESYIMENAFYRVVVSKEGEITSIYHQKLEKEILESPIAYEMQAERPRVFPSWNMDWRDRNKPPFRRIEKGGSVAVLEEGPLRATLQITIEYNASRFLKEISLTRDSEVVEFTERISWRELGCSLKLAFTAKIDSPEATFNWETSRIQRGINSPTLFEMPSRLWVDLSRPDWGIALIEDSKYGYDRPAENTLRMTLLYTPQVRPLNGFRDQKYHDWGDHTVQYGLYVHGEKGIKGVDALARQFNQKIHAFSLSHEAPQPDSKDDFSLCEISTEQVGVMAVKKPEDSAGILMRFYERYGTDTTADVSFKFPISHVIEVNGIEEAIGDVSSEGNKFTIEMGANGIRSYIITLDKPQKPQEIRHESLSLTFNHKLIGHNGDHTGILPAEMVPSRINAGNISFLINSASDFNALRCKGQALEVPKGFNTLSLLTASMGDGVAHFKWLNQASDLIKEEQCHISSILGYRGQWDQRIWKKEPKRHLKYKRDYLWLNKCTGVQPGYINRDRIEWYTTHTHQNGEDQPYQFGYLQTLALEIPKGAHRLVLPQDAKINILAATLSEQQIRVQSINALHDKFDL